MSPEQPIPFRPTARTPDAVASDWFGRRDGGLSPAEEKELQAWLAADPRHVRAFSRLDAASLALDGLTAFRPAGAMAPDPDLPLAARTESAAPRARRGYWAGAALAAAAALALAYLAGWPPFPSRPSFTETAATAVGGLRRLDLPDGSVVELNTDSAADIAYGRRDRHVTLLRGEAHFKVAKDPARPFTVSVGNVAVRAVGTAFNIRMRTGNIDVLVTEGRVRLNDASHGGSLLPPAPAAAEPPVLAAGHRALIATLAPGRTAGPAPAVVTPVAKQEILRELAWQQKRLEFGPTPLGVVVAEFNRYNRHQLVLADAGLASLSVGGSFEAGGNETLVRLLESSFGIVAEHRGEETILRRR